MTTLFKRRSFLTAFTTSELNASTFTTLTLSTFSALGCSELVRLSSRYQVLQVFITKLGVRCQSDIFPWRVGDTPCSCFANQSTRCKERLIWLDCRFHFQHFIRASGLIDSCSKVQPQWQETVLIPNGKRFVHLGVKYSKAKVLTSTLQYLIDLTSPLCTSASFEVSVLQSQLFQSTQSHYLIGSELFQTISTISNRLQSRQTATNSTLSQSASDDSRSCQLRSKGSVLGLVLCVLEIQRFFSALLVADNGCAAFFGGFVLKCSIDSSSSHCSDDLVLIAQAFTTTVFLVLLQFATNANHSVLHLLSGNDRFALVLERQYINTPRAVRHFYLSKHLEFVFYRQSLYLFQILFTGDCFQSSHVRQEYRLETFLEPGNETITFFLIRVLDIENIQNLRNVHAFIVNLCSTSLSIKAHSLLQFLFHLVHQLVFGFISWSQTVLNHPQQRYIFVAFLSSVLIELVSTVAQTTNDSCTQHHGGAKDSSNPASSGASTSHECSAQACQSSSAAQQGSTGDTGQSQIQSCTTIVAIFDVVIALIQPVSCTQAGQQFATHHTDTTPEQTNTLGT